MSYKAVIFDLDGTLLDTIEDLADSMNAVLRNLGLPEHSVEEYKYFVGDGVANLVRRALPPKLANEDTVNSCLDAMRREYSQRWNAKTRPYKGISELLDALTDKEIKLSILSNKPDSFTNTITNRLLSNWKFDVVFGERSGVPRKPDPAAAFEISRILGIPAREFIYLGDSGVDMQTATSADMYAAGALWGFRKADELISGGAKVLVGHPLELLKLID